MRLEADIVVVGAGHAGCEAALAAARMGSQVVMVTMRRDHIGRLSCNPAVGGLAKGNLVREIDALGGAMGRVADECTIQFRRLNTRKGLAVQASCAQVDIDLYPAAMQAVLAQTDKLEVVAGEVEDSLVDGQRIQGVVLGSGEKIHAGAVIFTTGTFLSAVMHCGDEQVHGGRCEHAANKLSDRLRSLGLRLGRLKTGTTLRLMGAPSIGIASKYKKKWSRTVTFPLKVPPIACRRLIATSLTPTKIPTKSSAKVWTGRLVFRSNRRAGTRYCPSIEDKIVRFAERDRHQLFWNPKDCRPSRYVNGLSTSPCRRPV